MAGANDIITLMVLGGIMLYAHEKGMLQPILDQINQFMGSIGGAVTPGGGGGGGTTTPGATVTGDTPYPCTNPQDLEDQGEGTRHYASGKSDDVTHEWEGSTSAQSYMVVMDITLTEIDHDDTISVKYGGSHMGSGWFDNGYSFESGQACIGKEENHPSTDLCEVTGKSIGNLVNTPVKIAAVNFGKGEKLEMWSNLGSGWTKDVETGPGVSGFRPSESEDEIQIRIDAAPGITMRSAIVCELSGTGGGGGTTAPTTPPPASGGNGNGNGEEEKSDYARALTALRTHKMFMRDYTGQIADCDG